MMGVVKAFCGVTPQSTGEKLGEAFAEVGVKAFRFDGGFGGNQGRVAAVTPGGK